MNKLYSLTLLRVFCMLQIFFLHYFAGIGLRNYIYLFSIAVPVFILMSAYLYGLKHEENINLGKHFLLKRFKTLSTIYYPFILMVFAYYAITDFQHIGAYLKRLGGELIYLTNFVKPLPGCGHLWFMQTLAFCYISLVIASRLKFVKRWFQSPIISLLLLILVICFGFLYRGADSVYLFFYLWTYYNAKKIKCLSSKFLIPASILILGLGYFLLSFHYRETFQMGIFLEYIQTCIMAIITIKLFSVLFKNTQSTTIITGLGTISMEFYLIHHLFVYNNPIYISLPLTLFLSAVLYFISQKLIRPKFYTQLLHNEPTHYIHS